MDINPLSITSITSQAQLSGIATVVTIRFAYDWQAGDYTGSVTYTAPELVKQFGSIEEVIKAPFCLTARQATRLAEYWCQRLSVPQYTATLEADRSISNISLGDMVDITHPHLPGGSATGALVTGREFNPESGGLTLWLLLPAQTLPAVTLSGFATRVIQPATSKSNWQPAAGDLGVTVLDEKGNIKTGAIATLDGLKTTTSDVSGLALFTRLANGKHTVTITATGYQTATMEFNLNGTPVEASVRLAMQAATTGRVPPPI